MGARNLQKFAQPPDWERLTASTEPDQIATLNDVIGLERTSGHLADLNLQCGMTDPPSGL
jgi:hypothetical protein